MYNSAEFLTIYPIHSARREPENQHGYDSIELSNGIKYYWLEECGTWYKTVMDRLSYNYCASDVGATADFAGRKILAKIAGGTVNDTTNSLSAKFIFRGDKNPQSQFNFYGLKPRNEYLPEIKNVVISDPYTIILWSDGTKTQVKCMEGDTFDPEHGFAMAVLKKLMEKPDKPNAYSKWVKQWVKQGIEAGKKQAARKNKKAEKKAEKETCDSCSWTFDQDGNVQTGPTNFVDYNNLTDTRNK